MKSQIKIVSYMHSANGASTQRGVGLLSATRKEIVCGPAVIEAV